jgi:hypothetical protein
MALSTQAKSAAIVIGLAIIGAAAWFALRTRGVVPAVPPPAPATSAAAPQPLPPSVDLIGSATIAMQSCALPGAPAVPNGTTASLSQMKIARNEFQAYDAATNSYVNCVDAAIDHIAHTTGSQSPQPEVEALRSFGMRAHNTAIDQETAYVGQFNEQLRAYKAKHPKS